MPVEYQYFLCALAVFAIGFVIVSALLVRVACEVKEIGMRIQCDAPVTEWERERYERLQPSLAPLQRCIARFNHAADRLFNRNPKV